MLTAADWLVLVAGIGAFALAALRWLRVAQREHYLPGAVLRFAHRWWLGDGLDGAAFGLALVALVASAAARWTALFTVAVAAIAPFGLGIRGRTSPLALTRRLRTLAALSGMLAIGFILAASALGGLTAAAVASAAVALGAPLLVDGAGALLSPLEGRFASRYVRAAARRLGEVRPLVVAITGSYGKTTTKGYVAALLEGRFQVLASPRSFNNQAGLARTVNDLLLPGTEVLVAEMGTYGAGELAALCSWLTPTVSVITAIGPVHLERFGTLEAILDAKAEITVPAQVSVLNVDDPLLARLAQRLADEGRRVLGCSARRADADVAVLVEGESLRILGGGELLATLALPAHASSIAFSNVACAVAVALELGVPAEELAQRLGALPVAENRLQLRSGAGGATILDDTFNSNPAGSALALRALVATGAPRRMVVTPGMVELGGRQRDENRRFGEEAARVATDLVLVGRTNRRALLAGVGDARRAGASPRVELVAHRDEAVDYVRAQLGTGDAVLYENDLPDHYR